MRKLFLDRVAEFFQAHEGEWIDGKDLESIGGRYAWRSRVSECRTQRGMTIDNRQRYTESRDGTRFTISEYRYLSSAPLGRAADVPDLKSWAVDGAPYADEPFTLTAPETR